VIIKSIFCSVKEVATTADKAFHIEVNGVNFSGAVCVVNTEKKWTTVTTPLKAVTMGKKKLKFVFDNGGMNLNYFTITDYNVSVQEMGTENSAVIYPNLTSCEVTISLAEPLKDESELSTINMPV